MGGDGDRATAIGTASTAKADLVSVTGAGRLQLSFSDVDLATAEVCAARGASAAGQLWRESFPADPPCRVRGGQRPATKSSTLR
ncbi:hypothetical protein [Streptomyces sp. NBC_00989]|uniref:hypothetical protein n=1 Tax=Streptomyces sp. NBC_00989 TaxID=2903705 RepID=UPI00387010EF|nr:hypothetical protein OG714_07445 [Streptomyces sp. NBC_00989]